MLWKVSATGWMLLVVAALAFGGVAWSNGEPLGNARAWLMVVLAIGWPATLAARRRA